MSLNADLSELSVVQLLVAIVGGLGLGLLGVLLLSGDASAAAVLASV